MEIIAIPQPTKESEKRKEELEAKKKLTQFEENELLHLELMQFWNCEC